MTLEDDIVISLTLLVEYKTEGPKFESHTNPELTFSIKDENWVFPRPKVVAETQQEVNVALLDDG